MIQKKLIIAIALIVYSIGNLNAQIINVNPNPDGDPWIAGGLPEITPEIQAELDAIPEMTLSQASMASDLPFVVDNSQYMYFRPIFNQQGGSCGQASGVGYTFTYEINRLRNLPANDSIYSDNWYPTHYTWNFLNGGTGSGSWYYSGWQIIKENGCPNVPTWGEMGGNSKKWMTGYNKYYTGMHNKVDSYWSINVGTPEGLNTFKHWLHDHNEGAATGGLACFAAHIGSGTQYERLPPESDEANKWLLTQWGTSGYHAMTFVGYNDNIKYDYNGDGLFTNNIDINNDGIVDMRDWEKGALKIANSWGSNYKNDGFVYMSYKTLAEDGAITGKKVYVVKAKESHEPELGVKVSVEHDWRRKVRFRVGYTNNANQTTPVHNQLYTYSSFNQQGGHWPMQGINDDPIEVGLDYNYFNQNNDVGKIFFIINEDEYSTPSSEGSIKYFSIIDYRWGEEFELYCDQTNVPIVDDGNTYILITISFPSPFMRTNCCFPIWFHGSRQG